MVCLFGFWWNCFVWVFCVDCCCWCIVLIGWLECLFWVVEVVFVLVELGM